MTYYCVVDGCNSKISVDPSITFHTFPRRNSFVYVTDQRGVEKKMETKKVWEMILLMPKPAALHYRICSLHFQEDDYYLPDDGDMKLRLRNYAVPTLNLPQKTLPIPSLVRRCSVKNCKSYINNKHLFQVPHLESNLFKANKNKWMLWLKALNVTASRTKRLLVCEDHFIKGAPSNDKHDPDYVPSINLDSYQNPKIEEIDVECNDLEISMEAMEDPLQLDNEINTENVTVQEIVSNGTECVFLKEEPLELEFEDIYVSTAEDSLKSEPADFDEFMQLKYEEDFFADHTYCRF